MMTPVAPYTASTVSPRTRVFVRDLAALFQQQMYFWGCDAKVDRNLLSRLGGERIAREVSCGEGSSRYRWRWHSGTVELHSFCAGWYPDDESAAGIVYIRGYRRFFDCKGGEPVEPGKYFEGRFLYANNVDLQALLRPLLTWLVEYERRVELEKGVAYRARCYRLDRRQKHSKPWLSPTQARAWLERFLASPETTPRAREVLRDSRAGDKHPRQRKPLSGSYRASLSAAA